MHAGVILYSVSIRAPLYIADTAPLAFADSEPLCITHTLAHVIALA